MPAGGPFTYMMGLNAGETPGFDPGSLDWLPEPVSVSNLPTATPVSVSPPRSTGPMLSPAATTALLPAPQRPFIGRLSDPITAAWRNLVSKRTGLQYGQTPTGSQAWFDPQVGETWLGGGIAGIDPNTGQPVYNPLGYGALLDQPEGGGKGGPFSRLLHGAYGLVSGRQFGVTPTGSGFFTPVPGEKWLGGGLAGTDPRTGREVYNPLGYGRSPDYAGTIADRGGFFGAVTSSGLPSFSGFLPLGGSGGGPYWHLQA